MSEIITVDVGQSGSRIAWGRSIAQLEVPHRMAPGGALAELVTGILQAAQVGRADTVLLSLTGLRGRVTNVTELGRACQQVCGCSLVAVCDDGLAWNLGALGGGNGTILAVGGGVVAVGRRGSLVSHLDGIGSDLGDDGGSYWLGRTGLRAVMRAHERRGAPTALHAAADARFGDLTELAYAPWGLADFHGACIAFARDVLDAAADDDPQAVDIATRGAARLASTACRASQDVGLSGHEAPLTLVGGLMQHRRYRTLVEQACADIDPTIPIHESRGDAMDGLHHLDVTRPEPIGTLLAWWRA